MKVNVKIEKKPASISEIIDGLFGPMFYVLDEHGNPTVENDPMIWATWMGESSARVIGSDLIGEYHVSTVFLGVNRNFGDPSNPILFETIIFGGKHDLDSWRYHTINEARAGHALTIKMLKEEEENGPSNQGTI